MRKKKIITYFKDEVKVRGKLSSGISLFGVVHSTHQQRRRGLRGHTMDGFALPTFTSFTSAAAMKKSPSNQSLGGASIDFDVLSAYLEQDGAYGFNENALPPSLLPSSGASSTGSGK